VLAAERPGFRALLEYIREGDTLHVYAVDRLGRDAIDVQTTIRGLIMRGLAVEIRGRGRIAKGVGELTIAVLAQVADMERQRIRERTSAGREVARAALATTGKTHRGKDSLGRPAKHNAQVARACAQIIALPFARPPYTSVSRIRLSRGTVCLHRRQ
jgi:putative DNA-invertase from lambdoid prophage Rac